MTKSLAPVVAILALLALPLPILAHQGATGIVKERMDAFKQSQDDLKAAIKAAKAGDFATVESRGRALADWAAVMVTFFPEGSNAKPSEAAPAIWSDFVGFSARAEVFSDAATGLVNAAKAQDKAAVMAAIGTTADSCKSCHKVYRLQ